MFHILCSVAKEERRPGSLRPIPSKGQDLLAWTKSARLSSAALEARGGYERQDKAQKTCSQVIKQLECVNSRTDMTSESK